MHYKIEKEASEFRAKYGFANFDPIRLKSLLLKLNVITLFKPLSENFSGMAVKVENARFMLINSNHSLGRQHFSISHELYHLFIQENFTPHHCSAGSFNRKDSTEYQADLFAAHLLMPKEGIISLIPDHELGKDKISLETILKVEHYFSCSRKALLIRFKELGLISSKTIDNFKSDIILSARKHGYYDSLYRPGNKDVVIGDFGSLAKRLFDKEKISEGHYLELMNSIGFDALTNTNADEVN
ncbi:ImmA/IrrE family metallo-endopeptidase [Marinilabilia rubra]|uniref:Transcriptional regulator n=1 Tax=Marinilabilia rubra TaxID=2162893 RepID=A0A2U2B6U4_9BACT|nr:ImmA/IrrE family metallo-endopeptidase [Marinilabilia rubra]PWD98775.1 transcriptional regulator [Marinilabilia rubra]